MWRYEKRRQWEDCKVSPGSATLEDCPEDGFILSEYQIHLMLSVFSYGLKCPIHVSLVLPSELSRQSFCFPSSALETAPEVEGQNEGIHVCATLVAFHFKFSALL
jgi:hypothetical protein